MKFFKARRLGHNIMKSIYFVLLFVIVLNPLLDDLKRNFVRKCCITL